MYYGKNERRHGSDCIQYLLTWMALTSWFLFLVALLAFHYARPEIEYGLLRYLEIDVITDWDKAYLPLFLYPLWTCCGVTLVSIIINAPRNKRFGDYRLSYLILLLLISMTCLVGYYVTQHR